MNPVLLPPNPVDRFYRGGARIARFRGVDGWGEMAPEEWIGSVTPVAGEAERGKGFLPDGTLVAEAIGKDPEGWLGAEHAQGFGADPGLLVKLLDSGERLPVHWHPDREFARARLHSCYGKTEAWIIVEADPGAVVHLGWRRDVSLGDLAAWQTSQDIEAMLDAMHRLPVRAGETVFVPAGTPHAIGEGILMVELQEPTDLSVLLEWKGFTDDPSGVGDLGLGYDAALASARTAGVGHRELSGLRGGRGEVRHATEALFPPEADAFFRAERVRGGALLPAGFSILVVVEGQGAVRGDGQGPGVTQGRTGGEVELRRGETAVVPHAAGNLRIDGEIEVLRCLPPSTPPDGKGRS